MFELTKNFMDNHQKKLCEICQDLIFERKMNGDQYSLCEGSQCEKAIDYLEDDLQFYLEEKEYFFYKNKKCKFKKYIDIGSSKCLSCKFLNYIDEENFYIICDKFGDGKNLKTIHRKTKKINF